MTTLRSDIAMHIRSNRFFRIIFTVLMVLGVISMGYYLYSGWNPPTETDAAIKVKDDQKHVAHKPVAIIGDASPGSQHRTVTNMTAGEKLFSDMCAACHGETTRGKIGPDLTVSKYKYGKTRLQITKTISEGRPGGMPAFGSHISKEQVGFLVEYVSSLK